MNSSPLWFPLPISSFSSWASIPSSFSGQWILHPMDEHLIQHFVFPSPLQQPQTSQMSSCLFITHSPVWATLALPKQTGASHHHVELALCTLSLVHLFSSLMWNHLSYLRYIYMYIHELLSSFHIYLICYCESIWKAALATFPNTDPNVVSSAVWGHTEQMAWMEYHTFLN